MPLTVISSQLATHPTEKPRCSINAVAFKWEPLLLLKIIKKLICEAPSLYFPCLEYMWVHLLLLTLFCVNAVILLI